MVKLFVQISTPNYSMPWQMKRQQQVFGSGFVISGRRILTNGHVVAYQKSVSDYTEVFLSPFTFLYKGILSVDCSNSHQCSNMCSVS